MSIDDLFREHRPNHDAAVNRTQVLSFTVMESLTPTLCVKRRPPVK